LSAEVTPIAGAGGEESPPALAVHSLSKRYPGVVALDDVSLAFRAGHVHGLVGENGAGKSTLIKCISGAEFPDAGAIEVNGVPVAPGGPSSRLRAGIAAIYQEPSTVPEMPVWANVFLGRFRKERGKLARGPMIARVRELSEQLGVELDPTARTGDLDIAQQQMIEIMRALEADHRILILDEPTSSLGPQERESLHRVVRSLREHAVAIIYVSHDLDEVLELCGTVSVLSGGELVNTDPVDRWDRRSLVRAMLGHDPAKVTPRRAAAVEADEILRVEGLEIRGRLSDVSFGLRRGEILGIAGLVGSGRTELLGALAGAMPATIGRLIVNGIERPLPRNVRAALRLGIALVPEDRRAQGLVLSLTGRENMVMSDYQPVSTASVVSFARRRSATDQLASSLRLRTDRLDGEVATLSGGNQQKVVVAKWLHRRPSILLLDEPTRGIDVGAKAEMLRVVHQLAEGGMSVIMVSSELSELTTAADRILVVGQGCVQGVFPAGTPTERLLTAAFGLATS
jgi:ABC-type sugar transport system ATPase subunit